MSTKCGLYNKTKVMECNSRNMGKISFPHWVPPLKYINFANKAVKLLKMTENVDQLKQEILLIEFCLNREICLLKCGAIAAF